MSCAWHADCQGSWRGDAGKWAAQQNTGACADPEKSCCRTASLRNMYARGSVCAASVNRWMIMPAAWQGIYAAARHAHLFFRVPLDTLRLRVACQWFFTELSVRPLKRRAMAAQEAAENYQLGSEACFGCRKFAVSGRGWYQHGAASRLYRACEHAAPRCSLPPSGPMLTCPAIVVDGLGLQEQYTYKMGSAPLQWCACPGWKLAARRTLTMTACSQAVNADLLTLGLSWLCHLWVQPCKKPSGQTPKRRMWSAPHTEAVRRLQRAAARSLGCTGTREAAPTATTLPPSSHAAKSARRAKNCSVIASCTSIDSSCRCVPQCRRQSESSFACHAAPRAPPSWHPPAGCRAGLWVICCCRAFPCNSARRCVRHTSAVHAPFLKS